MPKKVAYIAGPYSNGDTADEKTRKANVAKAREAAVRYWKEGYAVICPHLNTHDFDLSDGISYEDILEGDQDIIRRLRRDKDAIVMLDGWEESRGACEELHTAINCGLIVIMDNER